MRNFEALALNRILLTNRVADHELLLNFNQNIVFINPGLSDIKEKIIEALETKPQDISAAFLKQHSLWPRVEEITKVLVGKSGETHSSAPSGLSEFDKPERYFEQIEVVLKPHKPSYLLARAKWFNLRELNRAGIGSGSRLAVMAQVLVLWLSSGGRHIMRVTIGKVPFLRGIIRALRARLNCLN
jgi:hypothetical protein